MFPLSQKREIRSIWLRSPFEVNLSSSNIVLLLRVPSVSGLLIETIFEVGEGGVTEQLAKEKEKEPVRVFDSGVLFRKL